MTPGPTRHSLADAPEFAALYAQIRRIAQRHMRGESPGHTLSATGLANEVWLRLRDQTPPQPSDGEEAPQSGTEAVQPDANTSASGVTADFSGASDLRQDQLLALCSTFMRRILVDHARAKLADKRGALLAQHLTQSVLEAIAAPTDRDTVAVHDTLLAFEAIDPGAAKVVELRFFGGLSLEEIAAATERSLTSVKRDWTFARAWLHSQLDANAA